MPYANNNGVRIHYEVEGNGAPLVLAHGSPNSLEFWRLFGYVEKLRNKFRLILIDARGHGLSDKPHDPKLYAYQLRASDVVAVLDDLKISQAHYWGYSMGGKTGFAVAKYFPQRFSSIIIGGMSPYKSDPAGAEQMIELFKKGIEAAVTEMEKRSAMEPAVKAILLASDAEAFVALVEFEKTDGEIEDVLPTMTMPCFIYAGDKEPSFERIKRGASEIPNATFVSLPDLNHGQAYRASDLLVPLVEKFLAG